MSSHGKHGDAVHLLTTFAWAQVGGGNAAGIFTVPNINAIAANIATVRAANYTGIIFDVEEVTG
jgi:hypothetical protein